MNLMYLVFEELWIQDSKSLFTETFYLWRKVKKCVECSFFKEVYETLSYIALWFLWQAHRQNVIWRTDNDIDYVIERDALIFIFKQYIPKFTKLFNLYSFTGIILNREALF